MVSASEEMSPLSPFLLQTVRCWSQKVEGLTLSGGSRLVAQASCWNAIGADPLYQTGHVPRPAHGLSALLLYLLHLFCVLLRLFPVLLRLFPHLLNTDKDGRFKEWKEFGWEKKHIFITYILLCL